MKRVLGFLAVLVSAFLLVGPTGASAARKTVKISGKAFIFNHMDTYISGATIKVREFPKISAITDDLGDYVLTVPDDSNVTPYILSGEGTLTKHAREDDSPTGTVDTHWNEIDLQTFHTRGQNIENANFQTPQDAEYNALKGLLHIESNPETGRPAQCAIVTTASQRDVRDTTYQGYWENTPHGVEGATSVEYPALDGPMYFSEQVIPLPTVPNTSGDGGIIWPVVPTGTYRIVTTSPDDRFASFLATCAPGRVINANPPWGAYQLTGDEKPLGASNVAAKIQFAEIALSPVVVNRRNRNIDGRRDVYLNIDTAETLDVRYRLYRGRKLIVGKSRRIKPGERILRGRIGRKVAPGKGRMVVWMTDASGVTFKEVRKVRFQKVLRKKARKSKPRR